MVKGNPSSVKEKNNDLMLLDKRVNQFKKNRQIQTDLFYDV